METLFTVVMSKGSYVVREADALRVLDAIDRKDGHVLVEADLLGSGESFSQVRLTVAHVISIVCNANPQIGRPRLAPI
jgi:hypothetical protein